MENLVNENNRINDFFDNLKKYYITNESEIKKYKDEIEKNIIKYFEDNQNFFNLEYKNDVHTKPLFEIRSRVKSFESIKEKIIRKDCIEYDKSSELIVKSVDDLIGMKIITVSSQDVENANKCFKKYLDSNCSLFCLNKDNAKDTNKNGHTVYKYKIQSKYNIEVQIDSNFSNTWNEIEHTLFYKDYNYTFGKKNNKKIMEEVGNVVFKVDSLIGQIKENEKEYRTEKFYFENNIKFLLGKILENKIGNQSNYLLEFREFFILNILDKKLEDVNSLLQSERQYDASTMEIDNKLKIIHNCLMDNSNLYNFFFKAIEYFQFDNLKKVIKIKSFKDFFIAYLAFLYVKRIDQSDFDFLIDSIGGNLDDICLLLKNKNDVDYFWIKYFVYDNLSTDLSEDPDLDQQYNKNHILKVCFEYDNEKLLNFYKEYNQVSETQKKNCLQRLKQEMKIDE